MNNLNLKRRFVDIFEHVLKEWGDSSDCTITKSTLEKFLDMEMPLKQYEDGTGNYFYGSEEHPGKLVHIHTIEKGMGDYIMFFEPDPSLGPYREINLFDENWRLSWQQRTLTPKLDYWSQVKENLGELTEFLKAFAKFFSTCFLFLLYFFLGPLFLLFSPLFIHHFDRHSRRRFLDKEFMFLTTSAGTVFYFIIFVLIAFL